MSPAAGVVRWYADCCEAPLANTASRGGLPFVGLIVRRIAKADRERLGPVRFGAFTKSAHGEPRSDLSGIGHHVVSMLRLLISGEIKRRTASPFSPQGKHLSKPRLVSADERAAAEAKLA